MSWLSNLFGGGGEDPEAVRQRAAIQAAEQNRQALQMQMDFLTKQQQDQQARDDAIAAATAAKDPTAVRQGALQSINQTFSPDFQNSAINDAYTSPLITSAYQAQRGKADDYINNLLKRGVITDTGRAAAAANLDEQGAKVRTSLSDISDTLLNAERDKVAGIADRARGAASNLNVGDTFDINPYSTEYSNELGNFGKSVGDKFNAAIPGDLFDTKSLAALAGGAQGAGNQPFDPNALSGANVPLAGSTTSASDDPFALNKKPAATQTASVF